MVVPNSNQQEGIEVRGHPNVEYHNIMKRETIESPSQRSVESQSRMQQ